MRTWSRAPYPVLCGCCSFLIQKGQPVLVFRINGLDSSKRRCTNCAGEPTPDLPAYVEPQDLGRPMVGMVPVRRLAGLPFDWKRRQTGEREPGEDDD